MRGCFGLVMHERCQSAHCPFAVARKLNDDRLWETTLGGLMTGMLSIPVRQVLRTRHD
jgi:hypothetical protein